jgi:hypothetical protein
MLEVDFELRAIMVAVQILFLYAEIINSDSPISLDHRASLRMESYLKLFTTQ